VNMDDGKQNRRVLVLDDNPAIHEDFHKILRAKTEGESFDETRAALFGDPQLIREHEWFDLDCADQGESGLI